MRPSTGTRLARGGCKFFFAVSPSCYFRNLVIFAIDCIALTAIVLMQEGKSAGLGTISGMADTYWGQNKGRSMEGALVKSTKFLAILFIVLAAVLNLKVFA